MDLSFFSVPCVIGFPSLNEHLLGLLDYIGANPVHAGLGSIMSWAKTIGLCIALGVGANECYQMMLGRRGMDVMKILHIIIISFCITYAGWIASAASYPGKMLQSYALDEATSKNKEVADLEKEVADKQEEYVKALRAHYTELEQAKQAQLDKNADKSVHIPKFDDLKIWGEKIKHSIELWIIIAETWVCEWISTIVRWFGEIFFQVAFYGISIAQHIFMHLLAAFAPLMFAISLSPHYKSAWSQWLSKYISISLWGFIAWIIYYYVAAIMVFNLENDVTVYQGMIDSVSTPSGGEEGETTIGAIGMQAVGTTCSYVVGLVVGAILLGMVPDVASWLMPGGVSSGAAQAMTGTMNAAGGMIGSAAGSMMGAAVGSAPKVLSAANAGVQKMEGGLANMAYNTHQYMQFQNEKSTGKLMDTPSSYTPKK